MYMATSVGPLYPVRYVRLLYKFASSSRTIRTRVRHCSPERTQEFTRLQAICETKIQSVDLVVSTSWHISELLMKPMVITVLTPVFLQAWHFCHFVKQKSVCIQWFILLSRQWEQIKPDRSSHSMLIDCWCSSCIIFNALNKSEHWSDKSVVNFAEGRSAASNMGLKGLVAVDDALGRIDKAGGREFAFGVCEKQFIYCMKNSTLRPPLPKSVQGADEEPQMWVRISGVGIGQPAVDRCGIWASGGKLHKRKFALLLCLLLYSALLYFLVQLRPASW